MNLDESLNSFREYMDRISDSKLDMILSAIDETGIEGPSVEEYFANINTTTMETKTEKYTAKVHARPNSNDPKFIGTVSGNSIEQLKENARKHARSWNEHGGRLSVTDEETGREWIINS